MRDLDFFKLQDEVRDCKAAIKVLADGMRELRKSAFEAECALIVMRAERDAALAMVDALKTIAADDLARADSLRASNLAMRAVVDAAVEWRSHHFTPTQIGSGKMTAAIDAYIAVTKDVSK